MATSDTLINTLFDGRYRILRKLGSGGMANVYLAEDEQLDRRVAIKILNDRYAQDELFVERFRREAKSAAALSHPNIVSIYDRGEAEGHPYIAMEVVEGRSLKELIQTRGPLPVSKAIEYAMQILAAVRLAHKHGIIHRDIKPHNILLGAEDRLKVTDFGIARSGPSEMTEAGSIMGTAQYLSPEQARGKDVHEASDLYSVGIVLYEMLTGQVPYNGDVAVEVALKHVSETPRPPSKLASGIPPELDQVVLRSLAKSPQERYRSAEEFAQDLLRVQKGLPVAPATVDAATAVLAGSTAATQVIRPAQPDRTQTMPAQPPVPPPPSYPPPGYSRDRPRRRRRSVFPILLVLGLLAAAGVAGWYVYQQIQDQLQESTPVAVPLVVGLGEEQAVAKIEEQDLRADVVEEPSLDVAAGKVFRQEPEAGVRLAKNETVMIYVSSGVPDVEVPRLAGRTFEEATALLEEQGLEWERRNVFSRQEPGIVTSQEPKPGETVKAGSTVLVRVSKGEETVGVPDVVGQSQESATALLQEAEFEVAAVPVESGEPAGVVVAQSPEAGADAPKGSTITLSVSEGPQLTGVPNVVGFDRSSAQDALVNAGFVPSVQEQTTDDPSVDQLVVAQDPGAGAEAEPGSTVVIAVAVYVAPEPPPAPPPAEPPPPAPPPADGGDGGLG
jgi:serine/threonine-protein kinase